MPAKTGNKIQLLSSEMREIISYKPGWFLRNGMSVFVIITGILIALSFFVSYPDVITVKAKIFFKPVNHPGNSTVSRGNNYYAGLYISKNNIGKMKQGQKVIVKLPSYPPAQYGVIEGKLDYISGTATESGYPATAFLPDGLETNYHKKIQYREGLSAQVEIITGNIKLSDRLLNQFKPFGKNH